jgi:1-acyl-sn-glycerol-3-phosphate acyltransferase
MVERLHPAIKGASSLGAVFGTSSRPGPRLRDVPARFVAGSSGLASSQKSLLLSLRNVYETLAVSAPTVVDAARGQLSQSACNARLESWASRVVENCALDLAVRGREHIGTGRAYVIMSNHQSHMDVPVLYNVLGGNVRMVAKQELFELPIFGRALRDAGFIPVDRQNRQRAIENLKSAKDHLAGKTHIWIAPEGTRSVTGELLPFKKGGFVLALEAEAAILPITIEGTRHILPAKGLRSRPEASVRVSIHAPIDTVPFRGMPGRKGRDALMDEVRRAIQSALEPHGNQ